MASGFNNRKRIMIPQIIISALITMAPAIPKEHIVELPKQYAILEPEEKKAKISRQERRANKRNKSWKS